MEILSKITVKKACAFPPFKDLVAADTAKPGTVLWLCKIYGIGRRLKPDVALQPDGTASNFVRFMGEFRSVDMTTGRICTAGQIILPKIAQDLLAGAMESGAVVQFGFQLGIRYEETAVTKYVYVCESLLAPAKNDPLALLENSISTGQPVPALEGPKPTESELYPVSQGGDGAERMPTEAEKTAADKVVAGAIKSQRNGKRAA